MARKIAKDVSSTAVLSKERLDALVEDATTDCHDEEEQLGGLFTMIENEVELPFDAGVLGVTVVVENIDFVDDRIVAVCRSGTHKQPVHLADLPKPSSPPKGWEWIEAYKHWCSFK